MTHAELTPARSAAKLPQIQGRTNLRALGRPVALLILGAAALSGCISVEAPDKPIVIELNINITQEVIYRLAEDAGNAIDENADIF